METMSLQSKERFKKVMITDVAISKVPKIKYKGLTVLHYLRKDRNYSFDIARDLYNSCVEDLTSNSSMGEVYAASLDFLTHCTEAGLYYHEGVLI